jgi:hypothetical protein
MSNKSKYVDFVSPRGTTKYPRLAEARTFSKKENRSVADPDGQYELTLLMEPKDANILKAKVEEAAKNEKVKPDTMPFKKEVDKDTKKETGLVEVKFKAYGKKKDGTVNRIPLYDAKAKPLPADFQLTSGSIVKVAGYVTVAKLGARLNLRSVQVIEYVPPTAPNPFEAEEGFSPEASEFIEEVNGTNNEETDEGDYDF